VQVTDENVPAAQSEHEGVPAAVVTFPAVHFVQVDDRSALAFPETQLVQVDEPVEGEYFPETQLVQAPAFEDENSPWEH
jgi:hypothetical protein